MTARDDAAASSQPLSPHHQRWLEMNPAAGGLPAWLRTTSGELRLPLVLTVGVAIALQFTIPSQFALRPKWAIALVEIVLLAVLVAANPVRMRRDHPALRAASLVLTGIVSLANVGSAVLLVRDLVTHIGAADKAGPLLGGGSAIYVTNIIAFGLWYWELDRGGPMQRARGMRVHPDFFFPQMGAQDIASPDWEPTIVDYLYVSFTNAVAFSPTDTMPMSRWAKALMTVQSAVALVTIGLIIARAVNVLA